MSTIEEPVIKLTDDTGTEHLLTRQNAALYTFWGDLAIYDHVYMEFPDPTCPEDEEAGEEVRIFAHESAYPDLAVLLKAYDFPQYLNLNEIEPEDVEAYHRNIQQNLDFIAQSSFPDTELN